MTRLLRWIASLLLSLRYCIRIRGADRVAADGNRGILFLPNHPALIDPVILLCELHPAFRPRSLADKDRISLPILSRLAKWFGAIPMPDPALAGEARRAEVAKALDACARVLRAGDNLLLYPAGHLSRSRLEDIGGNSAVETLLARVPEARVVLVRTRGLWGSSFSYAGGAPPDLARVLLRGALHLFVGFLFFSPRRSVDIDLVEAEDFPRGKDRSSINRYLETFYNEDPEPARYVPYTPWERGGSRELPEPIAPRPKGDPASVSESVREQVLAKIREIAGVSGLEDRLDLARDLGMDSLSRVDLLLYVEQEFGHPCSDPDALQTVGDVLLAASGMAIQGGATVGPAPQRWFGPRPHAPEAPQAATIPLAFLRQAKRSPSRVAVADAHGAARSYRDLITAIFALSPHIAHIEGEYVGIMLPASVGAVVLYLATLFAGKTPVMINWTVGSRNMLHGLELLGVRHVITARALLSRLADQGTDLGAVAPRMLPVEDLAHRIGRFGKIRAFLLAHTSWASLYRAQISDCAVVLFTSGSESLPKAVPLTHGNILTNLRDVLAVIHVNAEDKIIGFLPPFHSFGLTCTLILPLTAGVPVVFHPNPTEGLAVARIVHAFRATMMVGTPTFLAGAVRAASDAELASLRLVVSGAEKCPDTLLDTIARRWPKMTVIEGYGITECSPVVSVNRMDGVRRGSIGRPLSSVEHAIADLDGQHRVALGETGVLLVRGPSIFSGYLGTGVTPPFQRFESKDWYRTGDLVREDSDGNLYFSGRLKRFIKLGGEMVSLPAIEEALLDRFERAENGPDLAVEALGSEDSPEIVLFTVRPISREEANAALRRAGLSPLCHIRSVRRVEAIPLLGTGKTDYRALKQNS